MDILLICDVWCSQAELDEILATLLEPAAQKLGLPAATPRTAETLPGGSASRRPEKAAESVC